VPLSDGEGYGTSPGAEKQEHQGYNALGEQVCSHVRRGLARIKDRCLARFGPMLNRFVPMLNAIVFSEFKKMSKNFEDFLQGEQGEHEDLST